MQRLDESSHDIALVRVVVAVIVGVLVSVAAGAVSRWGHLVTTLGCGLSGWIAGVLVYLIWTWLVLWPMDGPKTMSHANGEDLTRRVAHAIMFLASAAAIGGVGHL